MARRKKTVRDLPPAPGDLALVQAFLNTVDRKAKTDELSSPTALAHWLATQRLLPGEIEIERKDFERVRKIRRLLHAVVAGGEDPEQRVQLEWATTPALMRARFGVDGKFQLVPAVDGLDGALAFLLATVAAAQADGRTWSRLKVCASGTCRAVFYDASTNRSAKWCRRSCGNTLSARSYRRRYRSSASSAYPR